MKGLKVNIKKLLRNGVFLLFISVLLAMSFLASSCSIVYNDGKSRRTIYDSEGGKNSPTSSPSGSITPTQNITPTPANNNKGTNGKVVYNDVDSIHGSLNATDYLAVPFQKNGLIKSEVGVSMDAAYWSFNSQSAVTSTDSDLNGDGVNEQVFFQLNSSTNNIELYAKMGNKTIDLFGLVSKEFFENVAQMQKNLGFGTAGAETRIACIDLDNDNRNEILLAAGNDNGYLAVSLLDYTGGDTMYREVGGIKGTKELRYITITTENKIFAPLFITNSNPFDPATANYVEYAYIGGELKLMRCRDNQ